jgi:hypothetical protein
MQRMMRHGLLRFVLTAAALLAVGGATAAAAGETLHVKVPKHAEVGGAGFSIGVSGRITGTARLYVFVDDEACDATPHGEHRLHGAWARYWKLHGTFSVTSHKFVASHGGRYYACIYVVKPTVPLNSSRGVLATSVARFRIP